MARRLPHASGASMPWCTAVTHVPSNTVLRAAVVQLPKCEDAIASLVQVVFRVVRLRRVSATELHLHELRLGTEGAGDVHGRGC